MHLFCIGYKNCFVCDAEHFILVKWQHEGYVIRGVDGQKFP